MKDLSLAIKEITKFYDTEFMIFIVKAMLVEIKTKIAK